MTDCTTFDDAVVRTVRSDEAAAAAANDRAGVLAFLRDELRTIRPTLPATWPDEAEFRYDLGLDSLDLVELVARAEQRFQCYVADADLPGLVSLAAMADHLLGIAAP